LGAAGVHAFGESRLRHALTLHFLRELPGDDTRHRLGLCGFADTFLAQERIERGAPMGFFLVMPSSPSSVCAQGVAPEHTYFIPAQAGPSGPTARRHAAG
jgi:hypothetical protein